MTPLDQLMQAAARALLALRGALNFEEEQQAARELDAAIEQMKLPESYPVPHLTYHNLQALREHQGLRDLHKRKS